jgi:integrase
VSAQALTPTAVALIVKERALAGGLDPTLYSGHSLRAGFATSAALGSAPEWAIMKQTGHRSCVMLDPYLCARRRQISIQCRQLHRMVNRIGQPVRSTCD